MNIPFLDLKRQFFDLNSKIEKLLGEIPNWDHFILGEQVAVFEQQFATYIQSSFCISCANGTDALELALQVIGIDEDDEVIVPGFGWVSPVTAVLKQGAVPVLTDVDPITGNITPEQIALNLSSRTRAVIVIHLYGVPCEIESIRALCDEKGLVLIEDCAQAHGAEAGRRKVGSFGDLSTFSFYPTKNLGALGDAGAVLTRNEDWNQQLVSLRDYGRTSRHHYAFAGRNSRMDEIQAAILKTKLPYLEAWNEKRKSIANRYFDVLPMVDQNRFRDSVFYLFPVRVNDREAFIRELNQNGIGTEIHYPYTLSEALGLPGTLKNAKQLSQQVVSLPVYPQLTEAEISYICDHLKRLEHYLL